MKSFPKPLSTSEERLLLEAMMAGDTEARNQLIERNLRLITHIIKKYNVQESDFEDMISIGIIGLIKGIDSFDIKKGIRLATYVSRCIENEILMCFRSAKKLSKEVFVYEPIGTDKEGNEIKLMDVLEKQEEDVAEVLQKKQYLAKLEGYMEQVLNDRERLILSLRYGLGRKDAITQREVAGKLNISRSYVSRIEKKALQKLRKCYES
ncbi:MAG: RNA polymerase sporulation sigma factor SigK [Lachnospiraceae bacterium]|nr:RNA polymerase sporulation sigma factor SigK [Lachnospiraceae bacterium]